MKLFVSMTALLAAGLSIAATNTGHADSTEPHAVVVAVIATGGCERTFTVPMALRAARAVYGGTKNVTTKERRMLGRIEKCQRNENAKGYVRSYYKRKRSAWKQRRIDAANPFSYAVASWYDSQGPGACGTGAQDGIAFASLILPCGAQVEMCAARCAVGTMKDHGPYVGGRTFDLNVNMRDAVGCYDGVCTVRWRRVK